MPVKNDNTSLRPRIVATRHTADAAGYLNAYHHSQQRVSRFHGLEFPDIWLLFAWAALIAIGMVMVTSASMNKAINHNGDLYHYTFRQGGYYAFGLFCAWIAFLTPNRLLYQYSRKLLFFSFLLLLLIYIPGVGLSVNGARRWLNLRVFNLQVGEIVKLAMILYAAAFLHRNTAKLETAWWPMVQLLIITFIFAGFLLIQPDFGTTMVMVAVVLGMIFMAGVNLKRFGIFFLVVTLLMTVALIIEPYRITRLTTFLDPWKYKFNEGYQLVNSLIAVGSGGLFGSGLGQSVQKHDYLPEAHTDFIFAIIAEEFGLFGALVVMALFALIVWRAFAIGHLADCVRRRFACLVAYGVGLLIAIQALVNIGVTTGALPTKGLTLPLVSYGGSSVVIICISLGILARIDSECRHMAKREGILQ